MTAIPVSRTQFYGVSTKGNVIGYDPVFQAWITRGDLGGWSLKMFVPLIDEPVFCVNTQGIAGKWNGSNWEDPPGFNTLPLNWLAQSPQGTIWGVGANGNVVKWSYKGWGDQGYMGGWTITTLAFDLQNTMYAVGVQGNVGKWNGQSWDDQGLMGGWTIKMLAFDGVNDMWCVGIEGNIGKWNGGIWADHGRPSGWDLEMLVLVQPEELIAAVPAPTPAASRYDA